MNERIKELAEQAGLYEEPNGDWKPFASEHVIGKDLERFAELVAAAEREACAKLCIENAHLSTGYHHAAAIRGRTE